MELTGSVQCYEWGKLGEHSFVAKLAKANDAELDVKPDRSYAELWMGDHVNGPATLKGDGRTLAAAVQSDPAGTIGTGTAGTSLPFLLKVLSIRKALSVQVHPSKIEAEKLHAQFPDVYKDANHKPELAIALTDFQALCGFRAYGEILQLLERWEPLRSLIGAPAMERLRADPNREAVRVVYERLMRSEPDAIRRCIESMAECFRHDESSDLHRLFVRLYDDFGCDVGVLSIFFLNVLHLKPGEAIYLPANVPHAYLEGDCVECMACSDNVVRAGLTPKFKDVETLLRLVSYEGGPPETMLYRARMLDEHRLPYTRTFVPPVPDFAVSEIKLPAGARQYTLDNPPTGSILLVTSGRGTLLGPEGTELALQFGTVLFLPCRAGRTIALELEDGGDEPFLAFQAMANGFLEASSV